MRGRHMQGDATAKLFGRMTLNRCPLRPVGGLLTIVSVCGRVPVRLGEAAACQHANLRDRRNARLVALAGPVSNLVMAMLAAFLLRVLFATDTVLPDLVWTGLYLFVVFNVALAIFNLIPIPPLDGSVLLFRLLSPRRAWELRPILAQYGIFVLIAFILCSAAVAGVSSGVRGLSGGAYSAAARTHWRPACAWTSVGRSRRGPAGGAELFDAMMTRSSPRVVVVAHLRRAGVTGPGRAGPGCCTTAPRATGAGPRVAWVAWGAFGRGSSRSRRRSRWGQPLARLRDHAEGRRPWSRGAGLRHGRGAGAPPGAPRDAGTGGCAGRGAAAVDPAATPAVAFGADAPGDRDPRHHCEFDGRWPAAALIEARQLDVLSVPWARSRRLPRRAASLEGDGWANVSPSCRSPAAHPDQVAGPACRDARSRVPCRWPTRAGPGGAARAADPVPRVPQCGGGPHRGGPGAGRAVPSRGDRRARRRPRGCPPAGRGAAVARAPGRGAGRSRPGRTPAAPTARDHPALDHADPARGDHPAGAPGAP